MPTKRKLFLHIGSHRTATTSIQQFLNGNFNRLIERGFLFPFKEARHVRLMNQLFAGELDPVELAQEVDRRAANKDHPVHSVILSDEDISIRKDPAVLARMSEVFDVKIVFSLRRQDLWLESWYFQNVKWQWNPDLCHRTFDEFLARREEFHWIHYDRYIRRLEELFGQENILLSLFEKAQMPDGPVVEFCRRIGLTDISGFSDPPHVNSSMSAEMVEFLRHLPLDQLREPIRHQLRKTFEEVDRHVLGNTHSQSERMMPAEQRRTIMAEYEAGNRAIAERYFNRKELFFEPLPGPDAPLARLGIPQDSAALIERFVAPLLLQLVENGTIRTQGKS